MGKSLVLFHGKLQLTYSLSDSNLKHHILSLPLLQPVIHLHNLISHHLTIAIDHMNRLHQVPRRRIKTPRPQQITNTKMSFLIILKPFAQYICYFIIPGSSHFSHDQIQSRVCYFLQLTVYLWDYLLSTALVDLFLKQLLHYPQHHFELLRLFQWNLCRYSSRNTPWFLTTLLHQQTKIRIWLPRLNIHPIYLHIQLLRRWKIQSLCKQIHLGISHFALV